MKKIASLFILLFTVFIAKAEQVQMGGFNKIKFLDFIQNLQNFVWLPIILSLIMILWLINIERELKGKDIEKFEAPKILTRFIFAITLLFLHFIYFVLIGIILIQDNQGYLFGLKVLLLLFCVVFIPIYLISFTELFNVISWKPLKILKFFFVAEFFLLLLNLFDFYFRF